jgi:hypothetical protein
VIDWAERMEAIRAKREARGLPIGRVSLHELIRDAVRDLDAPDGTGEDYNPNRTFDYGEDIRAYPFQWRPTEPVRVSLSYPQTCACGESVRTLKPNVQARPRLCAGCLKPDNSDEIDLADLTLRSKEGDRDPLRAAALYLPGLADALDSVEIPKRRTRGRAYTIADKREAVRLYRDGMTAPEVAEKLGVTLPSVKNWVRRYADDPYFVS